MIFKKRKVEMKELLNGYHNLGKKEWNTRIFMAVRLICLLIQESIQDITPFKTNRWYRRK